MDVLLKLAQACDLYLLARVLDDESEVRVNYFLMVKFKSGTPLSI